MEDGLQIVGLGMATLDVLMRLKDMPTWERGTRLSGFRLEGGGPVGTAMVAAARLGGRVGFVGTAGTDEAAEIKNTQIAEELALPPVKIHCSVLAEDAIAAAITNYKEKNE